MTANKKSFYLLIHGILFIIINNYNINNIKYGNPGPWLGNQLMIGSFLGLKI